jgi:uncharacterized membrane protein YgcG
VTVTNGTAAAQDVVVQIPLPTFAVVSSVSSSAFCGGTSTLTCRFATIAAGSTGTIDIQLATLDAGNFTSNITMTALNDSTPGNNGASVDIAVTPAPTPPAGGGSSSGGGGGGGGTTDWLILALLSLLALVRTPAFNHPLCRNRDSCGLRH